MKGRPFALWLTGIPASGKSSIARHLAALLREKGVNIVVLESDAMRKILTPDPVYSENERNFFYRQLALIGEMITKNGVSVIFDATANRRSYRDHARSLIEQFFEVYVECPVEVCTKRDPKGIYAEAARKKAGSVPGAQVPYEPPVRAEVSVDGRNDPRMNAELIFNTVIQTLSI